MIDKLDTLQRQIAQARANLRALNEASDNMTNQEANNRAFSYWLGRLEGLINVFSVLDLKEQT